MTAVKGLGTYGNAAGVVTPLDHKLANAGLVAKASATTIRAGLFWPGTATIVSGKANMSYDVAAFSGVTQRSASAGAVFGGNDGTLNIATDVTGAALVAPGSNSRYHLVFWWHREYSIDGTDSNPVIGVLQGTAAASPTVPSLASYPGAVELARILVPAGVTATNSGTTITQKAPFTCMDGGRIPFRNTTERDSGTYLEGQLGWLIDTDLLQRYDGSTWATLATSNRVVPTAATNGAVSSTGVVTSTAQSLVRVRDAFPATFTVFRVTFDVTMSAAVGLLMRLAVGATDAATAYDYQRTSSVSTTVTTVQDLNQTSGSLSPIGLASRHVGSFVIYSPNVVAETYWDSSSLATPNPMTTSGGTTKVGGQHRTSTAYDSFSLFGGSGNVTINRLVVEGII